MCKSIYARRSKYKPYCFGCYCIQNPDVRIVNRYRLKEQYVHEWLKATFPEVKFEHNHRVDWYEDLFTGTLNLELDEHQHARYTCENKRIMEIFRDFGNRPMYLIRFNPDAYVDQHGIKHPSCFDSRKSPRKGEWIRRLAVLQKEINKAREIALKGEFAKEITIVSLFFNKY
jgi:hypothetical protein